MPITSRWLREAERDGRPFESAASNGGVPVCPVRMIYECVRRFCFERWAFDALYAPLRLLERFPLRAEKYYWATVSSVHMVERAFGGEARQTRHLHRHAVLTCYLDALVDSGGDLAWPLEFGLAVFGIREAPPPFLDSHGGEFRAALESDYPRLRLAAAGEHRELIVGSLLEAARVESQKRLLPHREHKLLSNLVCIRPFLVSGGMMDEALMEPLAMVYTFFDDALDVLEDLDAGEATHMATEAGVASGRRLTLRAISELNARAHGGTDWSALGNMAVDAAAAVARAQIRRPGEYREAESAAAPVFVRLCLTIFALYRILS